jgi:hypothetical protein
VHNEATPTLKPVQTDPLLPPRECNCCFRAQVPIHTPLHPSKDLHVVRSPRLLLFGRFAMKRPYVLDLNAKLKIVPSTKSLAESLDSELRPRIAVLLYRSKIRRARWPVNRKFLFFRIPR